MPVAGRRVTGPGLRITTEWRQHITVAREQRLLCIDEAGALAYRMAKDLLVGDQLVMDLGRTREAWASHALVALDPASAVGHLELRLPKMLTPDVATLWGLYVANGSLVGSTLGVAVNDQDSDIADWLERYLASLGLHPRRDVRGHCIIVQATSKELALWMEANDCHKQGDDSGAGSAHVPSSILRSPLHVVTAFLAAYFAGDGSVGNLNGRPRITMGTVSRRLVNEVVVLLRHVGMRVKVYKGKPSQRGPYQCRPCYEVAVVGVSSSMAFAQHVGFFGKRKAQKLADLLAQPPPRSSRRLNIQHPLLLEDLWLHAKGLPEVRADIAVRRRLGVFNLDWLRRHIIAHPQLAACRASRLLIDGVTYESISKIVPLADAEWVALSARNGEPVHAGTFALGTDCGLAQ